LILIILLLSCFEQDASCIKETEFTDIWWQVFEPAGLDNSCYLFSDDGFIVSKDEDGNNIPQTTWTTQDTECLHTIESDIGDLEIIGYDDNQCIVARYEGSEVVICECNQ
jgi:hypothetical protein|tara:strand:- start:657 stop:986 length:330 start_codon:yes stop_codon:yes gene_type:complete